MRVYLSHESAVQFLRGPQGSKVINAQRVLIPGDFVPSLKPQEAQWLFDALGVRLPVHSCVGCDNNRRRSQIMNCDTHSTSLLQFGYVHLGRQLFAATPELALAQVANSLAIGQLRTPAGEVLEKRDSIALLALIGSEFSSTYALCEDEESGFAESVCRLEMGSLRKLLERSGRFPGKALLSEAVPLMVPNAHSPAELQLATFASFPKKWGGKGMPLPLLNRSLEVRSGGAMRSRIPDLLYEDARLILEYNGLHHEGERADDDDVRRNQLLDAGYETLVVNKTQLQNAALLDEVLSTAARKTGDYGRRPSCYKERQSALRSLVFEFCGTRCAENAGGRVPPSLVPFNGRECEENSSAEAC